MGGPPKPTRPTPQAPAVEKEAAKSTLETRRRQGASSTVIAGQFENPTDKLGVA